MGPVANKIAAQFAYRLDILPPQIAFELAFSRDIDEEVPLETVLQMVREAVG